jgi:hypothetical protein
MVDGAKRECERMRRASVDSERQAMVAAGRVVALISCLSVASVTPNYLQIANKMTPPPFLQRRRTQQSPSMLAD